MTSPRRQNFFRLNIPRAFVALLLLHLLMKMLTFRSFVFYPEPFQDGGTNYLGLAIQPFRWSHLFALDAGYLPLLPRLLVTIVSRVFPKMYYPFALQYLLLILQTALAGFLLHPVFSAVIDRLSGRLFLALTLLSFPDYQSHLLENFSLYGIIFLFFFVLKDFLESEIFPFALSSLFAGLLFASKPFLLACLPFVLVRTYHTFRKTPSRALLFFPALFGAGLQSYVMIRTRLEGSLWQGDGPGVHRGVLNGLLAIGRESLLTLSCLFAPQSQASATNTYFVGFFIAFLFFLFLRKRPKPASNPTTWSFPHFFFLFAGTALLSLALRVAAQGASTPFAFAALPAPWGRHYLVAFIAFTMLFFFLLNSLGRRVSHAVFLGLLLARNTAVAEDLFPQASQQPSHWKSYAPLIAEDRYCIPVNSLNPHQAWWITRQCDPLVEQGPLSEREFQIAPPRDSKIQGLLFRLDSDKQQRATFVIQGRSGQSLVSAEPLISEGHRFRSFRFSKATRLDEIRVVGNWAGAGQVTFLGTRLPKEDHEP